MALVRLVLNFMVAGALLGVLAASLIGPKFIAWNNTTEAPNAMCICHEVARQGADTMIRYQMTWCAGGAVLGAIIGGVYVAMRKKTLPPAAAA